MGLLCSSDSVVCKVVYGIIAVATAALLCGLQRCFRKRLKKWLEIDIWASRRDPDYRCATIADRCEALPTNNGLQMNFFHPSHPHHATVQSHHINQNSGQYIQNVQHVAMANAFGRVEVLHHSISHTSPYGSGLPSQTRLQTGIHLPPHVRMSHISSIQSHTEEKRNASASHINQQIRGVPSFDNYQERTADRRRKSNNGCPCCQIFWRIVYFCLMCLYLYDFLADAVLSSEYFIRGEFQDFMLSIAPGTTSVLFSIPILLYLAATHTNQLSCLIVILLLVTSPIAKAIIYGWIVNINEQSWKQRWYLQALTFLQLLEVCIEGIPQFIFEYYIFLTESQTLFQSLQSLQKWFVLVSLLAVSLSITSVTTTLDREEDARTMYDEKLSNGIQPADEKYYWEKIKDSNSKLWYLYFVIVYIGRAFEFVPRCIIYTFFIQEFGLKVFGYFVGVYILILLSFSVYCFRKVDPIYSRDKCLRPLIIISTVVGAFANLFFCFEWLFRFLWEKKDLYVRYYALFYIVNLALCIANTSFAGGLVLYVILFPSTVVPQILLFLFRIYLRQHMRKNIN